MFWALAKEIIKSLARVALNGLVGVQVKCLLLPLKYRYRVIIIKTLNRVIKAKERIAKNRDKKIEKETKKIRREGTKKVVTTDLKKFIKK